MVAALALAAATLLAASETNTESVHGLASFAGRVVACTEGGLDLFKPDGAHERTLHVEDGLPSHFCRGLQPVGTSLFAATDEGVVEVGSDFTVRVVLPAVNWRALPDPAGLNPEGYRLKLAQLFAVARADATWTAASAHWLGAADGRVVAMEGGRTLNVPGEVIALREQDTGVVIVTTEGVFAFDQEFHEISRNLSAPLAYSEGVVLASDGSQWRLEGEKLSRVEGPSPKKATARLAGGWFGTRDDGVWQLSRGKLVRRTPKGQLCGNHVTAVARYQGRLVVGTFDRGVCWQNGTRWTSFHVPALPSEQVFHIATDGQRLYVATSHGLGVWDGRAWTQVAFGGRNPLGLKRLSAIGAGASAIVDGHGISFINEGKLARRIDLPDGWSDHTTTASISGSGVWIGSEDRGLIRFDGRAWKKFHDGNALTDDWVTAIDSDDAGRAVVGSCEDGFSYLDGHAWTRVRTGLPSAMVVSVALTPSGALIGTLAGAVRYDAASGKLTPLRGVADKRVHTISVDGDDVWFGTEGGLSRQSLGTSAAPAVSG